GELALVLYALTKAEYRRSDNPFTRWADGVARWVAPGLERWAEVCDWHDFERRSATSPFVALALLAFPTIEDVIGRHFACRPRVESILCGPVAEPPIDFLFLRGLLGRPGGDAE